MARSLEEQKSLWQRWKAQLEASHREPAEWESTALLWNGGEELPPDLLAKLEEWDWEDDKFAELVEFRGATFFRKVYQPPSSDWDHDHCWGCWAKFVDTSYERGNDTHELYHEGYVTFVPRTMTIADEERLKAEAARKGLELTVAPASDGQTDIWVCPKCFEQFRTQLGWTIQEN